MAKYEYAIIGAGPAGLALAYGLGCYGKRVLLVEREDSLGGCHRVRRVDGMFTEHGPRIYLKNYATVEVLLRDMGIKWDDIFVQDRLVIASTSDILSKLSFKEGTLFVLTFLRFLFVWFASDWSTSVDAFMRAWGFSNEARDTIDRLCRLTDGAGADRYTLHAFMQLINQNFFYATYQPKEPNDVGLFRKWGNAMKSKGVHVATGMTVERLEREARTGTWTIRMRGTHGPQGIDSVTTANNVVFAVPPVNMMDVLDGSPRDVANSFGSFRDVLRWSVKTDYVPYIPVSFHWDRDLELPPTWGFPATPWGVAFINNTDHTYMHDARSKTVITAVITKPHLVPSVLSEGQIMDRVLQEMRMSFPDLPDPDTSIMSPGVYRAAGQWQTLDTAFMLTPDGYMAQPKSNIQGLYTIGTHTGTSDYAFTSMETAVASAIALLNELVPESRNRFYSASSWTVTSVVYAFIALFVLLYIFFLIQ